MLTVVTGPPCAGKSTDPGPDVVAARIAEQRPAHVMAAAADYYARRADR